MVTNEREQAHSDDCERCYWRGRAEAAEAKVARVEALADKIGAEAHANLVTSVSVESLQLSVRHRAEADRLGKLERWLRAALEGAE